MRIIGELEQVQLLVYPQQNKPLIQNICMTMVNSLSLVLVCITVCISNVFTIT